MKNKKFKSKVYRDAWNINSSFEKWLFPRLKCLHECTISYPVSRGSMNDWKEELRQYVEILQFLVNAESSHKKNNPKYIHLLWESEEVKNFFAENYEKINKSIENSEYSLGLKEEYLCDFYRHKFGSWFGVNYPDLWW